MKVGIVTFYTANNYGAVLQCYALASFLKSENYDVHLANIVLPEKATSLRAKLRNKLIYMLAFQEFRDNYLPSVCSDLSSLDTFVFGSDQIWNLDITKESYESFMGASLTKDKNKVAYAASFGVSEWKFSDKTDRAKRLLNDFSAMGIREGSGVEICRDVFELKSTQVVDPTLLIDKKSYSKIFTPRNLNNRMVCYVFNKGKKQINNLRTIGSDLSLKPVVLNDVRIRRGIDSVPYPSVSKWLSYIEAADFVVTDSFHCMVFSILFEKEFIAIPAIKARAGRMTSLLKTLGLEGRFFDSLDDALKFGRFRNKIDYSAVNDRIDKMRRSSQQFLTGALEDL